MEDLSDSGESEDARKARAFTLALCKTIFSIRGNLGIGDDSIPWEDLEGEAVSPSFSLTGRTVTIRNAWCDVMTPALMHHLAEEGLTISQRRIPVVRNKIFNLMDGKISTVEELSLLLYRFLHHSLQDLPKQAVKKY